MRGIVAVCAALAISAAEAQGYSHLEEGYLSLLYDHNGSTVELLRDGDVVEIRYLFPRPGLPDFVQRGTILFAGFVTIDGGMEFAQGTAYIFRTGCGAIPYQVTGWSWDGGSTLQFLGEAPVLYPNSCVVKEYTRQNRNADLRFYLDRRSLRE